MPYNIRKSKCKQSSGKPGSYTLSYTDRKGKKHRACHTSRKKARAQISAIEMGEAENKKLEQPLEEGMIERILEEILKLKN